MSRILDYFNKNCTTASRVRALQLGVAPSPPPLFAANPPRRAQSWSFSQRRHHYPPALPYARVATVPLRFVWAVLK